nr:MAG: ORF1 [Torque teno midi virus]
MPFWWGRRKKFWYGRSRFRRRFKTYKKRRPRRRFTRRRARKAPRRRRRRRYKVRRKKKTIIMRQWQPDSIVKCRIKGTGTLVLGANGRQFVCYTNVKQQLTPPKAPCGGGFGYEQYSLQYLYREYTFRNNIWTKTNILKDLVRYLGVQFTFYRHQDIDFIIAYDRQPPFTANEYTYLQCHPQQMLLNKHKIILLSKYTKPNGKLKKKIKIRPPKQMITKWFFQKQFANYPLLSIRASAASFNYPHLGCCNTNLILTFSYINIQFYKNGNWGFHQTGTATYVPYVGVPSPLYFWFKPPINGDIAPPGLENKYYFKYEKSQMPTYDASINRDTGWFQPNILKAIRVTKDTTWSSFTANTPLNTCRYNPTVDDGAGNEVWLHSILKSDYEKPKVDSLLIMKDLPLWLILYGWLSYVIMVKKDQMFFNTYCLVIKSKALYLTGIGATEYVIPIDSDFVQGKWPFEEPVTHYEHQHWYPNIYHQLTIINSIVCCGPYVPKIDQSEKKSTWELNYFYNFFFKWGGPEVTDQQVADPQTKDTYDVPDKITGTIQVRNPSKQSYETLIHPWDYRRGIIKKSALKRMYENLSIDTSFEADAVPHKKKKITGPELTVPQEENEEILSCLHSLCEENIFQETEETDLHQLIRQQQQQQEQLKYNILKIISDLKEQQVNLQLQTGLLN